MRILYGSYADIAQRVKTEQLNIVIYGAGMIGTVLVPYIIEEYRLVENLCFYIDADTRKQGKDIFINGCSFKIESVDRLKELQRNTIIFITNSNYLPILKMMDGISELDNTDAYIIPILQACNVHDQPNKYYFDRNKTSLIPPKIHYCWFSGNPMPDYLKKCIDSWHKYCPNYEIMRWDESNYDVGKNLYMKQAYEAKKWGFITDFARLDILYEHGGIYLDTDVELLRNLDELLCQPAFVGVEKWGNVNTGGCCGAISGNPTIGKMLEYRKNEKFILEDGSMNLTTCGYYESMPLIEMGMKPDNSVQKIEDMTIYSSDFFHPYDYMSGETVITDNTFSIHHFNGGWLDGKSVRARKKSLEEYHQILERMQVVADEK